MSNPIRRPYQPIPKDLSKTQTWYCQGCGTLQPIESCGNGLDNGLELSGFGGYYGGFSDIMFDVDTTEQYDQRDKAHLCHDCIIKILTVLPVLSQSLDLTSGCHPPSGLHPIDPSQPPCCQWAWARIDNDTYYATINTSGNLVWEPRNNYGVI